MPVRIKDRFTRGLTGGFLAGVLMNILNYLSFYVLNFTEIRYLDWAAVLIYGHKPFNLLETLFAQAGQLFFASIMGVLFAYLLAGATSANHLLKGWVFGLTVWFSTHALTILYRVPELSRIGLDSASSTFISASLYGLALAWYLGNVDRATQA